MDTSSILSLLLGTLKAARFRSKSGFTFWLRLSSSAVVFGALIALSIVLDWRIASADGLLAGLAIFAGGFLAAFTHLSAVRQTLHERHGRVGRAEEPERNFIDIAVTNLLSATVVSALTAAVLVVGRNVSADCEGRVTGVFAGLTWAGSAAALWLFLSAIPSLYSAYVQMNDVQASIDGSDRT